MSSTTLEAQTSPTLVLIAATSQEVEPQLNLQIFHGPPGSGKGTQSAELGTPTVATGDWVRDAIKNIKNKFHNLIAPQAANSQSGGLIRDFDISKIALHASRELIKKVSQSDTNSVTIGLDGYPRTRKQWGHMQRILGILRGGGQNITETHFVYPLDPEIAIQRAENRLMRAKEYQAITQIVGTPQDPKLMPRKDDLNIRTRIKLYQVETIPAIMTIAETFPGYDEVTIREILNGNTSLIPDGVLTLRELDCNRTIHFIDPNRTIAEVHQLTLEAMQT